MNTIAKSDTILFDITDKHLPKLAEHISHRQTNPQFMRFLKETPMTVKQNLAILERELATPHCVCKGINIGTSNDIVGFLLFHCFDAAKNELELGFRICPLLQQKGICTQAVKVSIVELFAQDKINAVVGRHSAWNVGSFSVFRKSGFELTDFVANQTFLPNIGKLTDDFKWRICQDMLTHNSNDALGIADAKRIIIEEGLFKHQLQYPKPLFFHPSQAGTT